MQMDKQEKFYFIRENESGDIVYLPSKCHVTQIGEKDGN